MPFIPHTDKDTREMLDAIGADSIEDLFDEIPAELRIDHLHHIPEALSEMEIVRLMRERASVDGTPLSFIGAGAYEHHIPAAVWDIATRGEYYSAYTPYQAEASQGTLQTIYEYQTMITALTGLDVSNASLYDGASGLAEAALMAVRANRKVKTGRILLAPGVNPVYEMVAHAITGGQGLTFPGTLEDVDRLTDWAHTQGAFAIGIANPTSLALLKAPGHWGELGVDIACGEGQPLGVPLSSGGPYFGYMTCKQKHVRQMPGRIVGRTVDLDGNPGFALTLQAREQHIRRTKATSNICTNQGLMVTAATIYMSLLGHEGIARVARLSHANTTRLVDGLCAVDGVERLYDAPYFHEVALRLDRPVAPVLDALAAQGILAGYDLSEYAGTDALLVCATETKTAGDIDAFVAAFGEAMR
jgi:glycine dehydrogenase subunit 1